MFKLNPQKPCRSFLAIKVHPKFNVISGNNLVIILPEIDIVCAPPRPNFQKGGSCQFLEWGCWERTGEGV